MNSSVDDELAKIRINSSFNHCTSERSRCDDMTLVLVLFREHSLKLAPLWRLSVIVNNPVRLIDVTSQKRHASDVYAQNRDGCMDPGRSSSVGCFSLATVVFIFTTVSVMFIVFQVLKVSIRKERFSSVTVFISDCLEGPGHQSFLKEGKGNNFSQSRNDILTFYIFIQFIFH